MDNKVVEMMMMEDVFGERYDEETVADKIVQDYIDGYDINSYSYQTYIRELYPYVDFYKVINLVNER